MTKEYEFDPYNVTIHLLGCCDYYESWYPGIKEWGDTDEESRAGGYVSVVDYDKLLFLYRELSTKCNLRSGPINWEDVMNRTDIKGIGPVAKGIVERIETNNPEISKKLADLLPEYLMRGKG